MITWIIGGGGLLGTAIRHRSERVFAGSRVPWSDPGAVDAVLRRDLEAFRTEADGGPWAIAWTAGAATVASDADQTAPELAVLRPLLEDLRSRPPAGPGAFFLTSSAGGVYAGSARPPFDEVTVPVPISAYGELKLQQEGLATELLDGICPLVIGRVSNLYGPGQNLAKLQGLISQLALAAITHQPINIFVPLDTVRDYVYVDDAADAAVRLMEEAVATQPHGAAIRIIASGEGTTIAHLLRTAQDISRKRVPIALGSHPSARVQTLDLRFVPSDSGGLRPRTPLPVGMKCVFDGIMRQLQLRLPA